MADKIQNSFYLLEATKIVLNKTTKKIQEKIIDFFFIEKLMKGKGYKEQKLLPALSNKYEIKVFYKKNIADVKWKGFMKTIVEPKQPILNTETSTSESYIIFIKNITSGKFYACTVRICTYFSSGNFYK